MTPELAVVLILLAAAIVMFALSKPRMDAVALLMLTGLPFTNAIARVVARILPVFSMPPADLEIISMRDALAGFSDANVVLIAALFVIGDGLVRTGVAQGLGDWLTKKAGSSETRLIVLLMLVVCGLGATMSSTAVTAIFIPVVLRIARSTGTSPGRLMMPLSFAALISGMTTLVATAPNLVVSGELERQGFKGFSFFDFTPFGVPILILGVLYMLFARRWLGSSSEETAQAPQRPSLSDWVEQYKLAKREYRVCVRNGSPIVNKTIEEIRPRVSSGASLVAIERDRKLIQPTANTKILGGDILLVDLFAPDADVDLLRRKYDLDELPLTGDYFNDRSQEIGMAEIILPASSDLIDKTVVSARFRDRYGLSVIGLKRGAVAREHGLQNEVLKLGDTLLVVGPWKAIKELRTENNDFVLLNLPSELEEVLPVQGKAVHAVVCLALVVGLMISGVIPNVQAALIGCLLMGLLGCVTLTSAYRSIDWKTIVLIVGMLPFSLALQRTGGVDMMTKGLMRVIGDAGTYGVLACLFAVTAALGLFISNTATAVLMAPVAVALSKELNAPPQVFAMIVALAASTAFVTPVSSPVNTLVVTPGNYTFGDFVRIGAPFAVVVLIVCVILVPLLLPLMLQLYPH
jgi:di/tricarboxylate transporter